MSRVLTLILLTLPLLMAGCRDEGGPDEVTPSVTNIVTFTGNNDEGATFSYIEIDDSPELALQASVALDTALARTGDRLLARYVPLAEGGGDIALRGVSRINGGAVSIEPIADYPGWNRDGVYLFSAWRTGIYINIHAMLPYDETPRQFKLVADRLTVTSSVPRVYLVHQLKEEVNSHLRVYYASFDISAVWSRPSCTGIDLHVANTNLTDLKVIQFRK